MKRRKIKRTLWILFLAVVFSVIAGCLGYYFLPDKNDTVSETGIDPADPAGHSGDVAHEDTENIDIIEETIPAYNGSPYVELNGNQPSFTEDDFTTEAFEKYSKLDSLSRCGRAYANVCPDTMPLEERGPIGEVHPTGWQLVNYHDLIEGNYLYNRCHLIAYSLTGENANEKNLITGTRYLNTEGMQPFELQILDYVRQTGNHVLYRVTPVFEGENLLASGVIMEACSVEDRGESVSFHVYAYNVQPGVIIDYKTGDSRLDPDYEMSDEQEVTKENTESTESADRNLLTEEGGETEGGYVLNTNTHKFHRPSCDSVNDMKDKNKEVTKESRDEIIRKGYEPCGRCSP